MSNPFFQVSGDAQRALEEFSLEFATSLALADVIPWARQYGLYRSSKAIKTTFPIPISAAGYKEKTDNDVLRSLYTRSTNVFVKDYADGVAELARIVEAPDFIGWVDEPSRIAQETIRQPNLLVATMLEANPNLGLYKNQNTGADAAIAMFSTSHPVNIFDSSFGVFDNTGTGISETTINSALMKAVFLKFRTRKGPNGKTMRLRPTTLMVPPAREQEAKDFLESDLDRLAFLNAGGNVQQTANNRWKNVVDLVVADELTNDDDIFFLDTSRKIPPWIVQDTGSPEEIVFDRNSELYKQQQKIGVKYVLTLGVAPALPHAIERVHL